MYSQKYSVNVGVLQGCILCPILSSLYINDLPDIAVCNIAVYVADTFLNSYMSSDICFVETTIVGL